MRAEAETTGSGDTGAPPRAIDPELAERTAEFLRLVAEPNRIGLLAALNRGEAGVQELADAIGASHQRTSKHLGVLRAAGMVARRREGAEMRYSLADWTGWWVVEQVSRTLASEDG